MTKKGVNVNELPDFCDIENFSLRSRNRGAILANIYESYKGTKEDLLHTLEDYVRRFSPSEKDAAEGMMIIHLRERGYTIGN